MSLAAKIALVLAFVPAVSQAVGARTESAEEVAVRKVQQAVVDTVLHFETKAVDHLCGSPYLGEGTDVKVQIPANGHMITIKHYGVTYAGIFTGERTVVCSQ